MAERVFAVVAHPDDIEFVMAGTMLRLREKGFELHYMTIANGCCGSTQTDAKETARIRREESIAAATAMGATYHESLTNDLEIFYDRDTLLRLGSIMRQVAPRILLLHSPQDYMEDHMNACRLSVTAAFSRGMPNFPVVPSHPPIDQQVTLYHAQPHGNCDGVRQPVTPDYFVDVTEQLDEKCRLLACHASQKVWLDESQGMDSYLHSMRELCREVGKLSGRYAYAEGWRRHSHLGFCGEADDPLRAALEG